MRSTPKVIGSIVLLTLSTLLVHGVAAANTAGHAPYNGAPVGDPNAPWNSGYPCEVGASVVAAACNLSPALEANYPNEFGGLTLSNHDSMINVYMTSMPSGLQSFVNSIAPADAVTYVPCENTIATIWSVHHKVLADWSQLTASGIDVVGIGPDIVHSTEDVQVFHLTGSQRTQLEQEFGAGLITVQESLPSTPLVGVGRAQSRVLGESLGTESLIVIGVGALAFLVAVLALLRRRHHQVVSK